MDLSFKFNFSTAGRNKSVKQYGEESKCPPMDRDLLQIDIYHDEWSWYGSQREVKR